MAEVLAPCLELLRGLADLLTEPDKGVSETVWVEVWQASSGEGIAEDGADRGGGTPVRPAQPGGFKLTGRPHLNTGCREKRIIIAPQFFSKEIRYPIRNDFLKFLANRKKKMLKVLLNFVCTSRAS